MTPTTTATTKLLAFLRRYIPLWAFLAYLTIGGIVYTLIFPLEAPDGTKNCTLIDALYFSLVTVTTVGYGDYHPADDDVGGKLFTCVFAVVGISYIAMLLGSAVDTVLNKAVERGIDAANGDDRAEDGADKPVAAGGSCCGPCRAAWGRLRPVTRQLVVTELVMACIMAIGILVFVLAEGFTFVDALYFVVISCTTVGYGDAAPEAVGSKLFSFFWLALSTVWLAKVVQDVLDHHVDRNLETLRSSLLSRKVDFEMIKNLDSTGDGRVTRFDFLKYHLVAGHYPVDEDDIAQIMEAFDKLDRDKDGDIDKEDMKRADVGAKGAGSTRSVAGSSRGRGGGGGAGGGGGGGSRGAAGYAPLQNTV